jgi:glycosyltransferase involved in cell wall biosynthesis
MPELTVAMPAYNRARYIKDAIASVLRQRGVDFEFIIVDDGSDDSTADVVRSFNDPRIRLLCNDRRRGIGYCHNVIIRESRAPFIAHVDSDDLVRKADAFAKLLRQIRSSERIGQVHCYHFLIDADGRFTRESFRRTRRSLLAYKKPGMDYRRLLLVYGTVNNHLRMYRKAVFADVGLFNENLRYGEDYEMALRLIDKYEISLVPEFLYALRKHGSNTSDIRFPGLKFWWQRASFAHRLVKTGQIRFPRQKRYEKNRLMLVGLLYICGVSRLINRLRSVFSQRHRKNERCSWQTRLSSSKRVH